MKRFINILLLISFLIALSLTIWGNYLVNNKVGDISLNSKIDDENFIICNKNRISQYYSVGTSYRNGRKGLRKEIYAFLGNRKLSFRKSGYVSFRFIINCNEEIGMIRIKMVDKDLKETVFDSKSIKTLENSIKRLNNWISGSWKEENVDSYYQIIFKITDGEIKDIF